MGTKKYSTTTILNDGKLVPWASAVGPLSYSPDNPPDRDYFFQYTWVVPEIFNEKVNKRQHRWFGGPFKDTFGTRTLFDFWKNARKGNTTSLYQALGDTCISSLKAPIAVYKHEEKAILVQHLSYQIIKLSEQPFLTEGYVLLYRGVGEEKIFEHYILKDADIYEKVMALHSKTLSDSILSFNTVHSNIKRVESAALKDDTFILHNYAKKIDGNKKKEISRVLNSGYSLDLNCGKRKFGPHFVNFKTSLTNIRITTYFCGEAEVKIIDPAKLEIVGQEGCQVEIISI